MRIQDSEPYRLSKHSLHKGLPNSAFYTCARPGRSLGRKLATINDEVVHTWIKGITQKTQPTVEASLSKKDQIAIVSMLGRKPHGLSEFSYYSFRGGFDLAKDRPDCPTWQEWLTNHYGERYRVYEFPTEDLKPVNDEAKQLILGAIRDLTASGMRVVLVDSGGIGRTGSIVHALRFHEHAAFSNAQTDALSWGTK